MRYVIDIDGTIFHTSGEDYNHVTPISGRIEQINKLYDEGHHIAYFTARGMGRFDNDAKKAHSRFYYHTKCQLREYGCKFHDLIMGKPAADIYIDDKGMHSDEFFTD